MCWRVSWRKFLPLVILKTLIRSSFNTISGRALWIHRSKGSQLILTAAAVFPQVFPWWPAAPWFVRAFLSESISLLKVTVPNTKDIPHQHSHQLPEVVLAIPSRVFSIFPSFPANSCEAESSGFAVPWCSWQSWEAGEEGHSLFSCPTLYSLLWC